MPANRALRTPPSGRWARSEIPGGVAEALRYAKECCGRHTGHYALEERSLSRQERAASGTACSAVQMVKTASGLEHSGNAGNQGWRKRSIGGSRSGIVIPKGGRSFIDRATRLLDEEAALDDIAVQASGPTTPRSSSSRTAARSRPQGTAREALVALCAHSLFWSEPDSCQT
jgi:hypothetical protein